ncbi:hypothetical protein QKU48_gp0621 [Fadolivirus algeromassiliense]|jgi:hypothetical protein|uniref:ADP-ribosyltransferase exoenzyme domain protein n=1 Tax=Fadolivirus FV1/VV64 TaxID=3070911 RepID=A0A7D3QVZ1_9VIRU|nr:hypothetical protein QKU48_gp0621 [Fadolivirus algeromassiliense]QKF94079.1 hypothetical protein Fadolivirus_1_621 [Fadolivirus FV1/VV64]
MNYYLLYYKDDKTIKETKYEDVFDMLYYLKAVVPEEEHIKEYIKTGKNNKIKEYFKATKEDIIIQKIKDEISKIDNKVPLYDELKRNLFIIPKELVYKRVTYDSYRFPDKRLLTLLKEKRNKLKPMITKLKRKIDTQKKLSDYEDSDRLYYQIIHKNIKLQEEYHKLSLMIKFMKSFNNDLLETTYMKVFYLYANEVGKNITVCLRPSFAPHYTHIKPYYTRSELINLALNMEIIKPSNKYYDQEEIMKLCDQVTNNDISADTIMKHQEYIINNDKIGIIQYYSLQGSYFINQYMRNLINYEYKNELLETTIRSMWELVNNAPEFDKEYTLYRFIHNDDYLKHLNIGDTFTDPSFISTTRDPFYRSEVYKFGFILIKINIPSYKKGVGLCIESYSHFPEEQEIILSPLSILRLDKKDENALYYHTDDMYASKITTRYEFTYVGKEKISFIDRPHISNIKKPVDFINIEVLNALSIHEKIKQFIAKYVNDIFQFKTTIGKHEFDIIVEWYDSTNAYKDFYAATTNNGFSMYTIHNNYIMFTIELGEDNDKPYMYVNYYFKFASANTDRDINDNEFIEFLSKIAYYFGIKNVVLYAEYASCDIGNELKESGEIKIYRGGNYCIDYYKYLKNKERRFQNKDINIDSTELKPMFSYYELERLRTTIPTKVLSKEDRDELFQIYSKIYKPYIKDGSDNLADFYIWMVENQCVYIKLLTDKMQRLYNKNNPFTNDYYILDASRYLYNNELINELPVVKDSKTNLDKNVIDRIQKNEYRLQYYKRERVPSL